MGGGGNNWGIEGLREGYEASAEGHVARPSAL
jgi:hypothetical protein